MRKISLLTAGLLILGLGHTSLQAQSYLNGNYQRTTASFEGNGFTVYNFSREKSKNGQIKAKYFAKDAYTQFEKWKTNKKIIFYCSGAFSLSWETSSTPHGICVDNGVIVNRNLDMKMDGLVIVYNGGAQAGGIAVVNIAKEPVRVTQGGENIYDIRNNLKDRANFLTWASSQGATVFQTQLMYSQCCGLGFSMHNLTYGSLASRRFLAICQIKNVVHHIVIDYPQSAYLNQASYTVYKYLAQQGYEVVGLFNLDTGGKDIMRAYDGSGNQIADTKLQAHDATNLLVYYVE